LLITLVVLRHSARVAVTAENRDFHSGPPAVRSIEVADLSLMSAGIVSSRMRAVTSW
jgi:hypothetical protein